MRKVFGPLVGAILLTALATTLCALIIGPRDRVMAATAPTGPPPADALTPIVSTAAENNHVLKASIGNVAQVSAQNQTATAGFLLLLNATTAPADGPVTPLGCTALPASGSGVITYSYRPARFSTGIVAVVSSGANCFTKTTGTITAFISGQVQ